jgi:hypothetical protein
MKTGAAFYSVHLKQGVHVRSLGAVKVMGQRKRKDARAEI